VVVSANDVRCDFSDSSSSYWVGEVCENSYGSYVVHGRVPLRRRYVEEGVIGCDFSFLPLRCLSRARCATRSISRARSSYT